jgi:tRNA threonylcarbamoyladenosine biosynthesis protein TsaE
MISKSSEDTFKLGIKIGTSIKEINATILLYGDLGAGKTTLTKGIGFALGVKDIINSPTFSILKTYETNTYPLYHLDLYRLNGIGFDFDLEEYIDKGISVIEWPDNTPDLLPNEYIKVEIEIKDNEEREITISKIGSKYDKINL